MNIGYMIGALVALLFISFVWMNQIREAERHNQNEIYVFLHGLSKWKPNIPGSIVVFVIITIIFGLIGHFLQVK